MTLDQKLTLNKLWFRLISSQAKIGYYAAHNWNPRHLYEEIEKLEAEIQELTSAPHPRKRKP